MLFIGRYYSILSARRVSIGSRSPDRRVVRRVVRKVCGGAVAIETIEEISPMYSIYLLYVFYLPKQHLPLVSNSVLYAFNDHYQHLTGIVNVC